MKSSKVAVVFAMLSSLSAMSVSAAQACEGTAYEMENPIHLLKSAAKGEADTDSYRFAVERCELQTQNASEQDSAATAQHQADHHRALTTDKVKI